MYTFGAICDQISLKYGREEWRAAGYKLVLLCVQSKTDFEYMIKVNNTLQCTIWMKNILKLTNRWFKYTLKNLYYPWGAILCALFVLVMGRLELKVQRIVGVGYFATQLNKHTVVLFTYSINLPLKGQLLIDDGAKVLVLVHYLDDDRGKRWAVLSKINHYLLFEPVEERRVLDRALFTLTWKKVFLKAKDGVPLSAVPKNTATKCGPCQDFSRPSPL